MNAKRLFFIGAALLLLLLLLLAILGNRGRQYTWAEHYQERSKSPYGLAVVFKLLKSDTYTPRFTLLKKRLSRALPSQPAQKSNYVFIGAGQYLDSSDAQALLRFVKQGNDAFIATRVLPYVLMKRLYRPTCADHSWESFNYYEESAVKANFVHPQLRRSPAYRFAFRHPDENNLYEWDYFDEHCFCNQKNGFLALGQLNDKHVNFVRVPYGRGYFYLHSNPLFFTNLFLVDQAGKSYAEGVFAHLKTAPVYWDCYSKVRRTVAENMNADSRGLRRRDFNRPSPLSYILSQPPLAWAWYTLLATALIYFLFRIKRRQRVIPVLPTNKNNALAFVRTIGRLYFLQNSHRQLALQKMKLFLQFVRDRYKIQTRDLKAEFIQQLSTKSEIPAARIQYLLDLYQAIEFAPEIQERALVDFHQQIESFYKNCK